MTDEPVSIDADADALQPAPIDAASERAHAQATLYLRAIRSIDRRLAKIQEEYDEERARIDAWLEDMTHGELQRRERLVELLEQYGRAIKRRTGKAPQRTPYGRVNLTPPRDSLVVVDEEAFIDWAEGTDRYELVDYKKSVKKDAVKEAMAVAGAAANVPNADPDRKYRELCVPPTPEKPEGETVPGVVLSTPLDESVSVKVEP